MSGLASSTCALFLPEGNVDVCKFYLWINQVPLEREEYANKLPLSDPVAAPGEALASDSMKESEMNPLREIPGKSVESNTGQGRSSTYLLCSIPQLACYKLCKKEVRFFGFHIFYR